MWERGDSFRDYGGLVFRKAPHGGRSILQTIAARTRRAEGRGRRKTSAILNLEYCRRYGDATQLAGE